MEKVSTSKNTEIQTQEQTAYKWPLNYMKKEAFKKGEFLFRAGDIADAFVLRMPNAYPVYEKNYREALQVIKDFIGRFSNLQCMGRAGMFRYNNMDHSALTGFLAAENILGANKDLWSVNIDQSYHEELEENSDGCFG